MNRIGGPAGRTVRGTASVLAAILIVGCTSAAAGQPASAHGKKLCEILTGPPNAGLNHAVQAAAGVARARLGTSSVAHAGIAPSFGPFLDGRCGLILAAGYDEAPSIFAMAGRYPHQRFLLADDWFDFGSAADLTRPNVSVLAFEADQAAFLAGYAAAAVSQNHVVGEYGSTDIPTVDVALNGFLAGARAWGEDFRKQVTILGWNGTQGPFVGNDWDRRTAFLITERLIRGGAHVVFGVAGEAALGSAASAVRHPSVYLVGMYSDGYTVAPQYADRWLTSVVFDMTSPVLAAVRSATSAGPASGLYVGTIANGGVQLAPFHQLAHLVPKAVAIKLRALRAGLTQGWVSTNPAAYTPLEKETGNGNG